MDGQHSYSNTTGIQAAFPPELLDVQSVAALCQFSRRHVLRMVADGRMPAPLKVGRCVRWSRRAIEAWIAGGCPRVACYRGD